ncbi:MAG: bis-aminopropyl spermidine synthase family protein [archaeon]|nr:bis-aminopropyl spermidine synthase family protein [archaeon]
MLNIENIVGKRIKQGYDYLQTLRTLKGADPREVWEFYRKYRVENATKIGIINSYPEFPEPHSVFSQWRMTKKSTERIIEKIKEKDYEEVCFLGCPILGNEYAKDLEKRILLMDMDKETLKCTRRDIRKRVYDVHDSLPKDIIKKFNCVVTDPPWYQDDINLFISRAAQATEQGGTIYFSTPGLLTRPSVVDERLEMQKWLSENNLIIENISEVEYETPAFEYMAYFDIPAFSGENWRVGNFVKLKKIGEVKNPCVKTKKKSNWSEYCFGGKRVLLRGVGNHRSYEDPEVRSVNEDGSLILRTVSKRNALIPKIDLWSSRNAVLNIVSGYSTIKKMLRNLYNYHGKNEETAERIRSFVEM